nr:hypothetical protein [Natrinema soli]
MIDDELDELRWAAANHRDDLSVRNRLFYPVLCGVVTGEPARERLEAGMDRLLEEGLDCRCVADDP